MSSALGQGDGLTLCLLRGTTSPLNSSHVDLGRRPRLVLSIPASGREGEGREGEGLPPPLSDSWLQLVSVLTGFFGFQSNETFVGFLSEKYDLLTKPY